MQTIRQIKKIQSRLNDENHMHVTIYLQYTLTDEGKRRGKIGFMYPPELEDLYEGLDYVSGIAGRLNYRETGCQGMEQLDRVKI